MREATVVQTGQCLGCRCDAQMGFTQVSGKTVVEIFNLQPHPQGHPFFGLQEIKPVVESGKAHNYVKTHL